MFEANRDLSLRIHVSGTTRQSNIGFHRKLRFNYVFDKLGKIDKGNPKVAENMYRLKKSYSVEKNNYIN
jgi:hypothetical protein